MDCKESKKALLKMLNKRYTESTKDLTAELTQKWKETSMKEQYHLKQQITDLQTIDGGIRMDIKKDEKTGKYQISDAEQIDDTYDLHGLMFEFSRHNDGQVYYQFVQKTADDVCKKIENVEPKVVEVVKPPPIEDHKFMSFSKRCSGLSHSCDKCAFHEEHNL